MRCIKKGAVPPELTDWVNTKVAAGERADYRLGIPNADALRNAAMAEQHWLCCYTGRRISTCTLEHVKPYSVCAAQWTQQDLAGEDVDWNNLVAAHKTYEEPHYGESVRHDWYDADYVSPLEPDCGKHFDFNLKGEIFGTDRRGEAMVKNLRLDDGNLSEERRAAIDEAGKALLSLLPLGRTPDEYLEMISQPVNGKLLNFHFVLTAALPKLQS